MKQLEDVLARIKDLVVGPMHSTDLAELASLSTRCKTDLAAFASKLGRLNLTPHERRIGRAWKRLKAAFNEKELERMRDTIRDYIRTLNIRLTLLSTAHLSLSTTQSCEILDLLRQLRIEVRTSSVSNTEPHVAGPSLEAPTHGNASAPCQADAILEQSIDRLIQLVKGKECTVDSDDAEQLISDLQVLLESAQEKESSSTPLETTVDLARADNHQSTVLKELKLASSLIFSAPSIAINGRGPAKLMVPSPQGFVLQQKRKRKVIDTGSGTLTVVTNNRRRVYDRQDDSATTGNRGGKDFMAQIFFTSSISNSLLSISVSQGQVLHGSVSTIPRVLHGNIIPTDSQVFSTAAKGNVEDLVSLLTQGNASLHDHDPDGWSLLHVSLPGVGGLW